MVPAHAGECSEQGDDDDDLRDYWEQKRVLREQEYAERRQRFLSEQGYPYRIEVAG